MFGINKSTITSVEAVIWMLSTDLIHKIGFKFIRHSKHVVDVLMSDKTKLYNYVWDGNKVSIKWLQWLGFEISEPKPYGISGAPFRYFEKRAA